MALSENEIVDYSPLIYRAGCAGFNIHVPALYFETDSWLMKTPYWSKYVASLTPPPLNCSCVSFWERWITLFSIPVEDKCESFQFIILVHGPARKPDSFKISAN
jgi:hypothetical protein